PPYVAKNGPIDDISELLLIHGITPQMYWGPQFANHASTYKFKRPKAGLRDEVEPSYPIGLVDLFTTLSSGQININTAPATTLQLIPGIDQNIAQEIISRRAGPDGVDGDEDDVPFRSPAELGSAPGVNPLIFNQFGSLLTVRSTTFEVHVTAQIGESKRE